VLIVELLNTGIEMVVDRIGTDFHKLSGRAKDIGSAAVCLSMVLFILVWSMVIAQNIGILDY
jgi:diacylglycerol kinase (ATP)